ncbi:MAG TPA: hypothetical protein VMY41_18070 [Thermohalobaculum sp.]|nr:hypothetical protein [Thermohalobaculum sp.]
MSGLFSTDYQNCETIGRSVCVRRTEGQCRSENHCEQSECPLTREFSDAPALADSRASASSIGLGWLAGRING